LEASDFERRRAPYAPISSLREFLAKMREISVPSRVDRKFLRKLNVASNNEWALLSALKFLGIVGERGEPTHAYRSLQRTDRFRDSLLHLVETAYAPLLAVGGATMPTDDLVNYFRETSSASQARNAARFFREVSKLAGMETTGGEPVSVTNPSAPSLSPAAPSPRPSGGDLLLETKAKLLEKLPPPRPDWTAAEYESLCARFLELLRNLDGTA
jgi:hypothetical protein